MTQSTKLIDLSRAYEFIAKDRACPYLPDLNSKTQYLWLNDTSKEEYQRMLERGFRRFGNLFFNPICDGCLECLSVRIDPNEFKMTKSFKRVLKKNEKTRLLIRRPSMTKQHLDLHKRYHDDMDNRRGWSSENTTPEHYYGSFVEGAQDYGYEFLYFIDKKLIGVALVDVLPKSLSAVYCFYDPDYRDYSIGTLSILKQLQFAKRHSIDYLYLGYWVKNNQSLKYKERFKPFEVLTGRPDIKSPAYWRKYE